MHKPDVFVHESEFLKTGYQGSPTPGLKLRFRVLDQPGGKFKAVEVEVD
jgi:cold shock CspA family protein